MLSIALSTSNNSRATTSVDFPKKVVVEKPRVKNVKNTSNECLASMATFDPSHMSASPPGGGFMHNLRMRVEKV